jgi:hypothetical protein
MMNQETNIRRRRLLALSGLTALGAAYRGDSLLSPASAQTERIFNVLDYLTPAQIADVRAWTYRYDVATAIERASVDARNAGGGTVFMPAGGYLLGTLSKDLNGPYTYITARERVSMRGEGMNRTVLRVKAGENARLNGTNGPNIIATQQPAPLRDCSYSYFAVDWDGPNNLLKKTDTPRQNCSILAVNGGINITCTEVRSVSTPGNQCIFIPAWRELGQGNIRLIRCEAFNCGSGLPGNYNTDHSSFYANGTGLHFEGLRGDAAREVVGALFELHGSNARAIGCVSNNYQLGFWIAANFQPIRDIVVRTGWHTNVRSAFSLSGETQAVDNVEVTDCQFRQAAVQPQAGQLYFVNGNTVASCNQLYVHDSLFLGSGFAFMRFMQLFKIATLRFESNFVRNFATYGILASGIDMGGGRAISELTLRNNVFTDVKQAVYSNTPGLAIDRILIQNNTFNRSVRDPQPAIAVACRSASGQIGPNTYSSNYATPVYVAAPGVVVV